MTSARGNFVIWYYLYVLIKSNSMTKKWKKNGGAVVPEPRAQEETMTDNVNDRKHATRKVSFRLKKYTQKKKDNPEDPQSSAPNVELGESRVATMGNEEREGEMETPSGSEDVQRSNTMVEAAGGGSYSRDRPPGDDCCPICFDDFHIPCRTSCGHWFCGNCILRVWKYMADFKQCTCPICTSLIINVVPHSSVLIQPGQEVLKEIKRYNSQNMVGRFGIFGKVLAMPHERWSMLFLILYRIHSIGYLFCILNCLFSILHETYNIQLFLHGERGMWWLLWLIIMCDLAVVAYIMWKRWRTVVMENRMQQQQ